MKRKYDYVIGVLMMVKNEEESMRVTMESIKDHFDVVIVFDTGSTDQTIEVIKSMCLKNKQKLYLKEGVFVSFPESRNEALAFAEQVSCEYLLMMDAGDEFRTKKSKRELEMMFRTVPSHLEFDIGLIKQQWLDDSAGKISDHFDCRLVKNHKGIRYDVKYPVHEQVEKADVLRNSNFGDNFYLYQDRVKYGGSTKKRYARDIELLGKAEANKRNLYFLAQSYMSIEDWKNGFKYNVLSYQCKGENENMFGDEKFTLIRIAYCAMRNNMMKTAVKYLLKVREEYDEVPVDVYVYLFDIYIKRNEGGQLLEYVDELYNLKKPDMVTSSIRLVNHYFYDYLRYNLISVVCLMTNQKLDLGKKALEKILGYNKPEDHHNHGIYLQLMGV
jgi:glycosyltransferase involved in cell wall biosynthesis